MVAQGRECLDYYKYLIVINTRTFGEREELAHLLSGPAQSVQLPFLLQQLDQVHVTVVVEHVDRQLQRYKNHRQQVPGDRIQAGATDEAKTKL